jgi:hypothetical protein
MPEMPTSSMALSRPVECMASLAMSPLRLGHSGLLATGLISLLVLTSSQTIPQCVRGM